MDIHTQIVAGRKAVGYEARPSTAPDRPPTSSRGVRQNPGFARGIRAGYYILLGNPARLALPLPRRLSDNGPCPTNRGSYANTIRWQRYLLWLRRTHARLIVLYSANSTSRLLGVWWISVAWSGHGRGLVEGCGTSSAVRPAQQSGFPRQWIQVGKKRAGTVTLIASPW